MRGQHSSAYRSPARTGAPKKLGDRLNRSRARARAAPDLRMPPCGSGGASVLPPAIRVPPRVCVSPQQRLPPPCRRLCWRSGSVWRAHHRTESLLQVLSAAPAPRALAAQQKYQLAMPKDKMLGSTDVDRAFNLERPRARSSPPGTLMKNTAQCGRGGRPQTTGTTGRACLTTRAGPYLKMTRVRTSWADWPVLLLASALLVTPLLAGLRCTGRETRIPKPQQRAKSTNNSVPTMAVCLSPPTAVGMCD